MKNLFKTMTFILTLSLITSCSNDDDVNVFMGDTKTYQLSSVADPSISGTAKFIENENGSTTVELQLTGTPDGGMHPAHIHFNTAVEGGDIALTLGTVDGDTGFSSVTFTELNDGTAVNFADLLVFDGYINVHLSANDLGTLVAQGDIGQNELTGNTTSYALSTVDVAGISGAITMDERVNGDALATIQLVGTPDGGMHPAHIHMGSVATAPGSILFTFNPINGTTGISKTNVSALNDNTPFGYSDAIVANGYVNVHLSMDDLGTLVAQGNIGSN